MSDPIALQIAARNSRTLNRSALPDAPTVPDPPQRHGASARRRAAARLRHLAQHACRWADRLDPTHSKGPAVAGC